MPPVLKEKRKIYCAGPLFNPKERESMLEIADILVSAGYRVFLPQRDGIEIAKLNEVLITNGISRGEANKLLSIVIFFIDVFHVADSDAVIVNLNGRVPDEGAMVEAGIAWTLGRPVVIYKDDSRSAFMGLDNPLVLGLGMFKAVSRSEDMVSEFNRIFANGHSSKKIDYRMKKNRPFKFGRLLYKYYQRSKENDYNIEHFERAWEQLIRGVKTWGNYQAPDMR